MPYIIIFFSSYLFLLFLSIKRPAMAVSCFVHVFTIEQLMSSHSIFFFRNSSLINILLALAVILAFISSYFKSKTKIKAQYLALIIYSVLILYVFSTGAFVEHNYTYTDVKTFLPYYFAIVFLILTIYKTQDFLGFIKGLMLFGIPLVIGLALSKNFGVGGIQVPWATAYHGGLLRLNYLELGYTAGIVLICSGLVNILKNKAIDYIFRIIICLLSLYIVVQTGARGQTVFSIFSLIFVFLIKGKISLSNFLILMVIVPMFGFVVQNLMTFFWEGDARWSFERVSSDGFGRLEIAMIGLDLWAKDFSSILFGLGYKTINAVTGTYPHVVPLEILAEEGLIGFSIYLIFIVLVFIRCVHFIKIARISKSTENDFSALAGITLYCFLLTFKQGTVIGSWPFFLFAIITYGVNPLLINQKHGFEKKHHKKKLMAKHL